MSDDTEGLAAAHEAIDAVRKYYEDRGIFQPTFGFGQHAALLIIDMAYGWTDPAYATGSLRPSRLTTFMASCVGRPVR